MREHSIPEGRLRFLRISWLACEDASNDEAYSRCFEMCQQQFGGPSALACLVLQCIDC